MTTSLRSMAQAPPPNLTPFKFAPPPVRPDLQQLLASQTAPQQPQISPQIAPELRSMTQQAPDQPIESMPRPEWVPSPEEPIVDPIPEPMKPRDYVDPIPEPFVKPGTLMRDAPPWWWPMPNEPIIDPIPEPLVKPGAIIDPIPEPFTPRGDPLWKGEPKKPRKKDPESLFNAVYKRANRSADPNIDDIIYKETTKRGIDLSEEAANGLYEETANSLGHGRYDANKVFDWRSEISGQQPTARDMATPEPQKDLYHVTPTGKIKKIRSEGLIPQAKGTYQGRAGQDLRDEETIYAFEDYGDALRWAGKMDYDLKEPMSILRLKDVAREKDMNPQMQITAPSSVKIKGSYSPDYLRESTDVTPEMIRESVQSKGGKIKDPLREMAGGGLETKSNARTLDEVEYLPRDYEVTEINKVKKNWPEDAQKYYNGIVKNRNQGAVHPNNKTVMSLDFSTSCPKRESGAGACPYCYVEHGRIAEEEGLAFTCGKKLVENDYKGEILNMPDSIVQFMNSIGGLRMFAFGDYRPGKDDKNVESALKDAQQKGLVIKAITKTKEFVDKYGDHPNLGINISVDNVPREMSNSPTMEQAIEWKGGRDNVKIRTVALNYDEAVEQAMDNRVDVITGYHGLVGDKLYQIVSKQNPQLVKKVGEDRLRAYLNTWKNVKPEKVMDKIKKAGGDISRRVCCQGGKCWLDKTKCGFSKIEEVPTVKDVLDKFDEKKAAKSLKISLLDMPGGTARDYSRTV